MTALPPTRILTRRDVERLVTMADILPAVEQAFRAVGLGQAEMPPKVYVDLPEHEGDFRAMPVRLTDEDSVGLKWVCSYARNPEKGLPAVMAIVILNDVATAAPLAILDATWLTALRTGAGGGVAAKYLAREDASVVGLIGCGVQAHTQLAALRLVRPIARVKVWGPTRALIDGFLEHEPDAPCEACESLEQTVRDSDIVCTTTPVREPLVRAEWVAPGTHINAIGADAPGKQELESALLARALVVVDDREQAAHSGEINVPLARGEITRDAIAASLGEAVTGLHAGRTDAGQVTIFDSTGLAAQDLASARLVYRRAEEGHVGLQVQLDQ